MTSVTDFGQFTDLRALAGRDRDAALNKVAGQFEALFVQEMLKSMRAASFGDPIFGEAGGGGMYRDLFDQQIADDIASGTGVGLKDLLVRQLGGDHGARHTPAPSASSLSPMPAARASRVSAALATTTATPPTADAPAVQASAPAPENWSNPQAFIKDITKYLESEEGIFDLFTEEDIDRLSFGYEPKELVHKVFYENSARFIMEHLPE